MPPGAGKRDLHLSIDAEVKAYLEAEARYRRVPVSTLLLDACDLILHPERTERGALGDQLLSVADTLAKLEPQLQGLERTVARSDALGHELDDLRAEVRTSLSGVHTTLQRVAGVRRSHELRSYIFWALMLALWGVSIGVHWVSTWR